MWEPSPGYVGTPNIPVPLVDVITRNVTSLEGGVTADKVMVDRPTWAFWLLWPQRAEKYCSLYSMIPRLFQSVSTTILFLSVYTYIYIFITSPVCVKLAIVAITHLENRQQKVVKSLCFWLLRCAERERRAHGPLAGFGISAPPASRAHMMHHASKMCRSHT